MTFGTCKLTGENGKYIRSHILPKSLTKADGLETGLIQGGRNKVTKRRSSWYDSKLVTRAGEDILSYYDNWAVNFLRKHCMVWSGWGPRIELTDVQKIPGTPWGIRQIKLENIEEWQLLRLFFLSILWRSGSTDLYEFDEIVISPNDLEILGAMLKDRNALPLEFFPVTLTQISKIGIRHNHSPYADTKSAPSFFGIETKPEPIFRFFLDGLIIHFSRQPTESNSRPDLSKLRVGESNELAIATVEWDASFQKENLRNIMADTFQLME